MVGRAGMFPRSSVGSALHCVDIIARRDPVL